MSKYLHTVTSLFVCLYQTQHLPIFPSWSLMLDTVSTYPSIMVTCVRHSVYPFSLSHPSWSLMLHTVSTYSPCHVHCGHLCVMTQFIFYYKALCVLSVFDHASHSLPIPSHIMIFTDNMNTVDIFALLMGPTSL